eukprot:6187367-Pleurochrysis_carterae.AAC.2
MAWLPHTILLAGRAHDTRERAAAPRRQLQIRSARGRGDTCHLRMPRSSPPRTNRTPRIS